MDYSWIRGTNPGLLPSQFPDFATVSPPIADLQSFYKQSKVRYVRYRAIIYSLHEYMKPG